MPSTLPTIGNTAPKGPTGAQNQIAESSQDFMSTMQKDFGTTFADQQNILSGLTKNLTSIFNAGPSQFGFSAPEQTALNTLATTQNATNYANARAAAGAAGAGPGGGSVLPTGANAEVQANLASKAAQEQSNALLGISEAGYKQGNENWKTSMGGLEDVAKTENPAAYGELAIDANKQASSDADTIYKEQQAANPMPQIMGMVGSLASGALNLAVPGAGSLIGSLSVPQANNAITQGWGNADNMSVNENVGLDSSLIPQQSTQGIQF